MQNWSSEMLELAVRWPTDKKEQTEPYDDRGSAKDGFSGHLFVADCELWQRPGSNADHKLSHSSLTEQRRRTLCGNDWIAWRDPSSRHDTSLQVVVRIGDSRG